MYIGTSNCDHFSVWEIFRLNSVDENVLDLCRRTCKNMFTISYLGHRYDNENGEIMMMNEIFTLYKAYREQL